MANLMLRVTAASGDCFYANVSACRNFGFNYGDRIRHPLQGEGTVIGVAPAMMGWEPEPDVLWCKFDNCEGLMFSYPLQIEPA